MTLIVEAKVQGKWKELARVPLPGLGHAPGPQEFRHVFRGPLGLKVTLIGRVRFE